MNRGSAYHNTLNGDVKYNFQNTFREEFAKFENQVWNYSSLRPSETFKIDHQFPSLLVESFAKLFRMWRDYSSLKDIVRIEQLKQIRDDLNECLAQDISYFEVLCDTCDGKINVERNDLEYSFHLHSQTARHQEALKNFCDLMDSPNNDVASPEEHHSVNDRDDFNGYIVLERDNSLSCSLCNEKLSEEVDAIKHVASWQHILLESPFCHTDRNYIVEINNVVCCRLCLCQIPDKGKGPSQHMQGKFHQLREKCCNKLRENEPFVKLLNRVNGEFRCELCDSIISGWALFLRHCETTEHVVLLTSTKPDNDTKKVGNQSEHEEDFILCLKDHYECTLCQCALPVWEIASHKRQEAHMRRRQAVLNDVASSSSQSLNSDSECDYSKVMENNDYFIDLSLTAGDNEVFKCLLCAQNGTGLENLESHCLTEKHRVLKTRIEKVGTMIAEADLVDEDDNRSIELVDDVYFCHLCDYIFDNHGDMMTHEKDKNHLLLKQQRQILRENKVCISKVNDEEPPMYFCYLCDQSVEGDVNIVAHGQSKRHKVLLDIVQGLSKL